jgi:hypothetical protein
MPKEERTKNKMESAQRRANERKKELTQTKTKRENTETEKKKKGRWKLGSKKSSYESNKDGNVRTQFAVIPVGPALTGWLQCTQGPFEAESGVLNGNEYESTVQCSTRRWYTFGVEGVGYEVTQSPARRDLLFIFVQNSCL